MPRLVERLAILERDHPYRFNLVLVTGVALVLVFAMDPLRAALFFALALPLRFWFMRPNGLGQRIRARHWKWDAPDN